ncbi:MAG: hypothetical protein WBA22_03055 [Candidatus Methanofastidiosia archaeon]
MKSIEKEVTDEALELAQSGKGFEKTIRYSGDSPVSVDSNISLYLTTRTLF